MIFIVAKPHTTGYKKQKWEGKEKERAITMVISARNARNQNVEGMGTSKRTREEIGHMADNKSVRCRNMQERWQRTASG